MEQATSIELFVEILDRYVYYFDQANDSVRISSFDVSLVDSDADDSQVTTKYINGLIELIHSNIGTNQQDSAGVESSKRHFRHTLENIAGRQYEGIVLYPQK